MCKQQRLISAHASAQSDQNLQWWHEDSTAPVVSIERETKTLVGLMYAQVHLNIGTSRMSEGPFYCDAAQMSNQVFMNQKKQHAGHIVRKLTFQHVRPAKTPISLCMKTIGLWLSILRKTKIQVGLHSWAGTSEPWYIAYVRRTILFMIYRRP